MLCCDANKFTENENHQTSNLNMKYYKGMSRSQADIHGQQATIAIRGTPPDVNCFITRSKPLKNLLPPYKLRFRTV